MGISGNFTLSSFKRHLPNRKVSLALAALSAMVITPAIVTATETAAPQASISSASVSHNAPAAPAPAAPAPAAPAPAPPAPAAPAPAVAPVSAPVPAKPANAGTSIAQLEPTGTYGYQSSFGLDSSQMANAKHIVQVVEQRGMPLYAATIAVSTAMQETKLENMHMAVDHDSLGLFQQRPSSGWGSPSQLCDPTYATNAFLAAMEQSSPNYMHESLWHAAQATQRSGFPTRYAQWENQAAHLVQQIVNGN